MGLIFIRNANGSHNPDGSMAIEDFLDGTADFDRMDRNAMFRTGLSQMSSRNVDGISGRPRRPSLRDGIRDVFLVRVAGRLDRRGDLAACLTAFIADLISANTLAFGVSTRR